MSNETQREALSALMDGELPPDEAARLLDAMATDPELREFWRRQHQVSGLLSGHSELVEDGGELSDRVRQALEREPVPLKPRQRPAPATASPWTSGRRLALAASVALVAVVVGLGLNEEQGSVPTPEQVAATAPVTVPVSPPPTTVPVSSPPRVTVATRTPTLGPAASTRLTWNDERSGMEARLNGYLLNHNEYLAGGVRGMLPYARVVGYDPRN